SQEAQEDGGPEEGLQGSLPEEVDGRRYGEGPRRQGHARQHVQGDPEGPGPLIGEVGGRPQPEDEPVDGGDEACAGDQRQHHPGPGPGEVPGPVPHPTRGVRQSEFLHAEGPPSSSRSALGSGPLSTPGPASSCWFHQASAPRAATSPPATGGTRRMMASVRRGGAWVGTSVRKPSSSKGTSERKSQAVPPASCSP